MRVPDVRVLPRRPQDPVRRPQVAEPAGVQALQRRRGRRRQDDEGASAVLGRLLAHLLQSALRPVRRRHGAAALGRRQQLGRQRPAQGQGRLRVLREARRRRSTPSTTATSPPKARRSRRATPTSTRSSRSSRTSRRAPASSCSGARPTCSPTPATCTARPPARTSTSSPSPPPRSRRRMEVTHELGGAGYTFWGGREGYSTLLNTDMKRELDHLGPLPPHGRRLQEADRLHRHVLHRAQAEGADQAPVRLRRRRLPQLPADLRPAAPLQAQPRDQPRHARRPRDDARAGGRHRRRGARARSTPTPATRCSAGTPTSSRPTST